MKGASFLTNNGSPNVSGGTMVLTRGFAALALAKTVVLCPKYESTCDFSSAANSSSSSKKYSINHRTFRNEFSVYSNVLRVIRNIAVPTQMCSLEFKTEHKHVYVVMYRVFFFILTQEWVSFEPILGLLRPQKASMSTQDWAQITFR